MSDIQEKIKKTDNIIEKTKIKISTILDFIEEGSITANDKAAEAVEHLSKALYYMQQVKEMEGTE